MNWSLVESNRHKLLLLKSIICGRNMPYDIYVIIGATAIAIILHEINANKCVDWIVNKLRDDDIVRISIDDEPTATYAVRKTGDPLRPYIINSALTHHNDLYKLCHELVYAKKRSIRSTADYRGLFLILNDFITSNPARIRDILSNFTMTAYDLIYGIHVADESVGDIIYILINADCKQELLTCGFNKQTIFWFYLNRSGAIPRDQPGTQSLLKYPLFIQYFDLVMNCPLPLSQSAMAMIKGAEFD